MAKEKRKTVMLTEHITDLFRSTEIECPSDFSNEDVIKAFYGGENRKMITIIHVEEEGPLEVIPVSITNCD